MGTAMKKTPNDINHEICTRCVVICMESKWMLVVYNDAMIMREDYSAEAFMCVNLLVNKKDHNVMYVCNIYYY